MNTTRVGYIRALYGTISNRFSRFEFNYNTNKMSDKSSRLRFKKELTEIDYLKILIEQNQTLIQFASMQQNNLIHGALNTAVISMYNDAIDDYIDKTPPPPPAEIIPEEKKAMIANLKRRQEEGEDISKIASDLGLSKYLNKL